jgi:hypothetical protein
MVMNTNTERPTVRDWLASGPFRGKPTVVDYHGFKPTERQIGVLEQAALRGFLYDPDPEPGDFPHEGGREKWYAGRCWPEHDDITSIRVVPEWAKHLHHRGTWEARCAAAGRPWQPWEWFAAPVPLLYGVWDDYCAIYLKRPSVAAGRFLPEHWHGGADHFLGNTLGVRVHTSFHDGAYWTVDDQGWAALLLLAVGGAQWHELGHWLYSDDDTIAVQTAAENAEPLAAALTDRLLEVLEPGWDTPEWDLSRKAINS